MPVSRKIISVTYQEKALKCQYLEKSTINNIRKYIKMLVSRKIYAVTYQKNA